VKPSLSLVLAALAVTACAHVTSTNDSAAPESGGAAKTPARQPASHPVKLKGPVTGTSAAPKDERPAAVPGRPQLASSPAALMRPEGPALIQRALGKTGYLRGGGTGTFDRETEEALRKFQEDRQLARTGAPDRDTLRKLGLVPEDVFLPPAAPCTAEESAANQSGALAQRRQCTSE
jgi:peptidoglycan hydrolase-like protein with peptidoglycan-binding domain